MSVVVVTDAAATLPPEVAEQAGVLVAPVHVLAGDLDSLDTGAEAAGDPAPGSDAGPTGGGTAGATPDELEVLYLDALERSNGDGVLALHLSRHLSSTWSNALAAAERVDPAVRVVDSGSVAMGLGFPVLALAERARAGASLRELLTAVPALRERTQVLATVATLDQLRRGGRISTAAALLGTALSIKPVLAIEGGRIVAKEKTRTLSKAIDRLIDTAAGFVGDETAGVQFAVQHVGVPERARELAARLADRLSLVSAPRIFGLGPALATHLGTGAVGIITARYRPDGSIAEQ